MKKMIKSLVLAACLTMAAGAVVGMANAEEALDGMNPCDMGANPCSPDGMTYQEGDGSNPCDSGSAENPCAAQPDDSYYISDDVQAPDSGAQAQ